MHQIPSHLPPCDSNCHIKFQQVSRAIALQHDFQIVIDYIKHYHGASSIIQSSMNVHLVFKVLLYKNKILQPRKQLAALKSK